MYAKRLGVTDRGDESSDGTLGLLVAPAFARPPSRPARLASFLSSHWGGLFSIMYGTFVLLPLLAPFFMKFGLDQMGRVIYYTYSFVCHQLPQRSFFLFGLEPSYSLVAIQTAWRDTADPMILRQFIGNTEMGWKVAWSDRMFSMYTSVLFFAWIWFPLRGRIRSLPLWGLVLLALPMLVDGGSHLISDLAGIGQGFRDTNAWLTIFTGNVFTSTFYAGDQLGSFNSWMRLISGGLFGLGLVWFAFPEIEKSIA